MQEKIIEVNVVKRHWHGIPYYLLKVIRSTHPVWSVNKTMESQTIIQ